MQCQSRCDTNAEDQVPCLVMLVAAGGLSVTKEVDGTKVEVMDIERNTALLCPKQDWTLTFSTLWDKGRSCLSCLNQNQRVASGLISVVQLLSCV